MFEPEAAAAELAKAQAVKWFEGQHWSDGNLTCPRCDCTEGAYRVKSGSRGQDVDRRAGIGKVSMATENLTLLAIENLTLCGPRRGGSAATAAGRALRP